MPGWAKTTAILVGILALVGLVAYIVFIGLDPPKPEDDCALLARQQTASVDIDATVRDLELIKGRVGVTAGQVQEVDAILKDYAVRYEALCRDHRKTPPTITDAEYQCRRDNMDQTLSTVRALSLTLAEVKNVQEASAQRDIVLKDIETIQKLSRDQFRANCGSALVPTPAYITFNGDVYERTIEIVNAGNRNVQYHIADLIEAFTAIHSTGPIPASQSVVVAIRRTPFPVPTNTPVSFYVGDNFGNRVPVSVLVDEENAQLYSRVAQAALSLAESESRPVSLADALVVIERDLAEATDSSGAYFLAAGALIEAGSFAEASRAFQEVKRSDKDLYDTTPVQLLAGISEARAAASQPALMHFENALAYADDGAGADAASKVMLGAFYLTAGREQDAARILSDTDAKVKIQRDHGFRQYVEAKFEISNLRGHG